MQRSFYLLAVFAISVFTPFSLRAQQKSFNFKSEPATQLDLASYSYIGGITTCALLKISDTPVDLALQASASGMMGALVAKHQKKIEGMNNDKPLDESSLYFGSLQQVITRVKDICYNELKGANLKAFDDVYSKMEAGLKKSGQPN